MNSSAKTDDAKKMIEVEEEIDGEHSETTDYFFERIGEPVPIKPKPFNFDPQNPPSLPLAVSELHGIVFLVHSSDGTYGLVLRYVRKKVFFFFLSNFS